MGQCNLYLVSTVETQRQRGEGQENVEAKTRIDCHSRGTPVLASEHQKLGGGKGSSLRALRGAPHRLRTYRTDGTFLLFSVLGLAKMSSKKKQ